MGKQIYQFYVCLLSHWVEAPFEVVSPLQSMVDLNDNVENNYSFPIRQKSAPSLVLPQEDNVTQRMSNNC